MARRPRLAPHDPSSGLSYAAEKFSCAVHTMAVSQAPIRQRIRDAHGEFSPIGEEDFPEGSAVRSNYIALMARMSWAEDTTGRGTIAATLGVISDREARRLASLICDVASGIQNEIDRHLRDALYAAEKRVETLTAKARRAKARAA